jgi:hypothetical protein
MNVVTWNDISKYVAAGNLDKIFVSDDFDSIRIEIIYAGLSRDGVTSTANISLECIDCCYFDIRRRNDHEPGPGIILDAYLHTESDLITALHNSQLEGRAGSLCLESGEKQVYHLEIIGEVSLNALCESVVIKASPLKIAK